ncbi:Flavohemoprotein [Cladobotryum mycophilum]|uniref:nitric oxide dioxygenase n=1 Tax=Cladobotryum mycophilum TaxID=491253 RepID=A0ABR0S7R4_9HYPO
MTLTPDQIAIVKSTAPVIKQHGQAVTSLFYKNLLSSNPGLQNYFSLRNQQTGAQQAALAHAVLASATYIDDLPKIAAAVERIAQKHASLFVRPEQYPIVGEFLIGAFAQVLGEAFTEEVKSAWVAAYGVLADIFINREKQLYAEAGDWQDWRNFTITKKEIESEGVYVSVQIPIPELNGIFQSRQFSLSLAPHDGLDHYRITVKNEASDQVSSVEDLAAGKTPGLVAQRLHNNFSVGSELQLSPPHGEFAFTPSSSPSSTQESISPIVLLSIGSTRPITWVHGARHSGAVCYGKHVRELSSQHANVTAKIFVKNIQEGDEQGREYDYAGRLSLDKLTEDGTLPLGDASTEYYICGPEEWMVETRAWLDNKGVSRERQHLELFRTGMV